MAPYRRIRPPGATYFFTLRLAQASFSVVTDRIAALRRAYAETMAKVPIHCCAMVVLPDHPTREAVKRED